MSAALLAGVDEAGRGPLAGPVVAAAVVLDPRRPVVGLQDSKKLSAASRERLALDLRSRAAAWSVASASVAEIDELNIRQATLLAMRRAVLGLTLMPTRVLVDGLDRPELDMACEAVVGGDASVSSISAASILAKVARDRMMCNLDALFPDYGFARHNGYPTRDHMQALGRIGPCAVHRRTFRPVRRQLAAMEALCRGAV
jgi:ribonuclease HII